MASKSKSNYMVEKLGKHLNQVTTINSGKTEISVTRTQHHVGIIPAKDAQP
jgi:hypothetical protein